MDVLEYKECLEGKDEGKRNQFLRFERLGSGSPHTVQPEKSDVHVGLLVTAGKILVGGIILIMILIDLSIRFGFW